MIKSKTYNRGVAVVMLMRGVLRGMRILIVCSYTELSFAISLEEEGCDGVVPCVRREWGNGSGYAADAQCFVGVKILIVCSYNDLYSIASP
ncbi:MAG: hypothetical protein GX629_02890 [Phycisphaerae bacterium]|jgi:hypothetical protein|nr:hypothetical protein [Phycisphaerae bacterium]